MQRTLLQCVITTFFLVVFLQSKNQPTIKLLPSLLATELRSNASTQCLFHPAPIFRFVTSWELGVLFLSYVCTGTAGAQAGPQ